MRYEAETKEIYDKSYNLSANIITPLESFPKLNFLGIYESEENFYHPKLVFNTASTDLSIDTTLEVNENFYTYFVSEKISKFITCEKYRITGTRKQVTSN